MDAFEFAQEEKFASAMFAVKRREFGDDRSRLAEFSHQSSYPESSLFGRAAMESVVTNSREPFRQDVEEEAPNQFEGRET